MAIGTSELIAIVVVGAIVFFFGSNKVKDWITAFRQAKLEAEKPSTEKP